MNVRTWHLVAGAAAVLVVGGWSLFIGVSHVTPLDVLRGDEDQVWLVLASRLPRLLATLLAGAAMSIAGLIMQHLARNRFVAPSTAGTVESASLGLLVATLLFGERSVMWKMAVAVVFALVGTWLFLRILRRLPLHDLIVVPLVGIMFGGVIGAATTFLAYRYDLLQTMASWTNADFSGIIRGRYELLWIAAAVTAAAYAYADRFTVAGLGEEVSTNLGLSYRRVVNLGLAVVAVTTAVVVVTVGAVPFLGLIVPNVATVLLGDNLRKVLPFTAVLGAGFVLVCDVIGRVIRAPYEIPVGTVAGVIGSAVFIAMLLNARSQRIAAA